MLENAGRQSEASSDGAVSGLFQMARGEVGAALLVSAVTKLKVFEHLRHGPIGFERMRRHLGIEERPLIVLLLTLQAMGTLRIRNDWLIRLTGISKSYLLPSSRLYLGEYLKLLASSACVREVTQRLRSNQPRTWRNLGPVFSYRDGFPSPMEVPTEARRLTVALSGLALALAPIVARRVELRSNKVVLDVGGGTGFYALALLKRNPQMRAIILDRPEVLKVTSRFVRKHGLQGRVELCPADMFTHRLPSTIDTILLSNVLHDWDVPACERLLRRCSESLPKAGKLIIHDEFIQSASQIKLSTALHSAHLFLSTKGRLYMVREVTNWLRSTGLRPAKKLIPTDFGYSVLTATKH